MNWKAFFAPSVDSAWDGNKLHRIDKAAQLIAAARVL